MPRRVGLVLFVWGKSKSTIQHLTIKLAPLSRRDRFAGDPLWSTRLYTLSVQFLNRSAFVKELVEKHHLLQILSGCLVSTLAPACRRQSVAGGAPGNQGRPPNLFVLFVFV